MAHRLVAVDTATFALPSAVLDALNIPENASDVGARPDDWQPAWADVQEKPSTFPPSTHSHDDLYYTKIQVDGLVGVSADAGNMLREGTDGKPFLDDTPFTGLVTSENLLTVLSDALGWDVTKFLKPIDIIPEWDDNPDPDLPANGIVLSETPEP